MKNIKWIVLFLIVFFLMALCSCSKSGEGTKKADNKADFRSMYDYAQRLEERGDYDAAAAVCELIAKNGGADFLAQMHEDVPLVQLDDEMNEIEDIFGRKEADGK